MANLGGKFLFDQPIQFEGDSVSIGDEHTFIDPSSSHCVALGAGATIGSNSTGSIVAGAGSTVGNTSPNNTVLGQACTVGNGKSFNIVMGNTLVANGNASIVGGFHSVCQSNEGIALGFFSIINGGSDNSIAIGSSLTLDVTSPGSILIGTTSTIETSCPSGIGIGQRLDVASPHAIVMGDTSQVIAGMDCSVALNANLNNTNATNTKASIAINGYVGTAVMGSPLLITANVGGNIALGSIIYGNTSVGCTAINGFIGAGSTTSVSINSSLGQNCTSNVCIGGGSADGLVDAVAVLGTATTSYEVVIGKAPTILDPSHGVTLFHSPSTILNVDLFAFSDSPISGSTGLTVIYNSSGTFLNKTVLAAAVTGVTGIPDGSLVLYMNP